MTGHGAKFERKKEEAIVALLSKTHSVPSNVDAVPFTVKLPPRIPECSADRRTRNRWLCPIVPARKRASAAASAVRVFSTGQISRLIRALATTGEVLPVACFSSPLQVPSGTRGVVAQHLPFLS